MSISLDKVSYPSSRTEKAAKPRKNHAHKILLLLWIFLICCGVWGTKLYSDHLRAQIASQIEAQTKAQLAVIQQDYAAKMAELKAGVEGDMSVLQSKVDSLTELLAFAKDSANEKTDNSNQLYTQLEEVKKKLEELKKNMDVLK